ncbi:hypothetical protein [Streptomyces sp. AK010]|uniref:hypothetical protein n=1 Tax=Streptomyces sp. AK010 TaxID=2723074 RepID=UPI001615F8A1|nr:hypothetical protein [Streptomyces sp. AK010]MBB6419538.1 hypothetical protein [Streptomyces sp. AK010]
MALKEISTACPPTPPASFFAKAPADPSVCALRMADGGVLALFPAAHKQESLLKEAYRSNVSLVPGKEQSAFGATRAP